MASDYRSFLPYLAVAETIATRGKSPGTMALKGEQIYLDAEERKKQAEDRLEQAKVRALQQRVVQAGLDESTTASEQKKNFSKALINVLDSQGYKEADEKNKESLLKDVGLRYSQDPKSLLSLTKQNPGIQFQRTNYIDPVSGEEVIGNYDRFSGQVLDTDGKVVIGAVKPGRAFSSYTDPVSGSLIQTQGAKVASDVKPLPSPVLEQPTEFTIDTPPILNEVQKKIIRVINKDLKEDDSFNNAKQSLGAAFKIKALIESKNPLATRTIQNQLAKASGEVGRLTELDVDSFAGNQALIPSLKRTLKKWKDGNITDGDRELMSGLADILVAKNQSLMNREIKVYYGQEADLGTLSKEAIDFHMNRVLESQSYDALRDAEKEINEESKFEGDEEDYF